MSLADFGLISELELLNDGNVYICVGASFFSNFGHFLVASNKSLPNGNSLRLLLSYQLDNFIDVLESF